MNTSGATNGAARGSWSKRTNRTSECLIPVALLGCALVLGAASAFCAAEQPAKSSSTEGREVSSSLEYIYTGFEGASPLYWETAPDGTTQVYLVYDQERNSPNRANGHWLFQIQARRGTDVVIVLNNFDNVWNGRRGSPLSKEVISYVSADGKHWQVIPTELVEGNRLKLRIHMDQEQLYVARLEPYRISDLERLKRSIARHRLVQIRSIGHTVQGRDLEMIRIGNPQAPHRVLLRARAHPWEPGGNWVIEGVIERLLRDDAAARRYLATYCVYAMPMANKDGVAAGRTRFNMQGMDLNRNWDRPADPQLAPENHALERWLQEMIAKGRRPDLAIDFHNDNSGRLHISRPEVEVEGCPERMQLLERLLRKHTWFTEGSTGASFRNPGTFGEGLLERFGITACIHELNANRIAGLDDYPSAKNWRLYGSQLCEVFFHYFQQQKSD